LCDCPVALLTFDEVVVQALCPVTSKGAFFGLRIPPFRERPVLHCARRTAAIKDAALCNSDCDESFGVPDTGVPMLLMALLYHRFHRDSKEGGLGMQSFWLYFLCFGTLVLLRGVVIWLLKS
jgi:hypothetical protein